ncbi:MAG: 2-phospho-L-lactate transferase [Myxococcota bacterium]
MSSRSVVALAGGVGAARFLRGLVQVVPPERVCVIVNTGDDRDFFGLRVCPDLDIVTYTLAGCVREETGWGIAADSFHCLEALRRLRTDAWFQLGDRDLATHIHRSARLRRGATLSAVTREIVAAFGLRVELLPMSDDPAPTRVLRRDGSHCDFEEYLVRDGAPDDVEQVDLSAARASRPAPGVCEALEAAEHILICPSNPIVSVGPIRAVPGIEKILRRRRRAVAVSPIIAGHPVKGPADRLMRAMGSEVSALGVARLYREILSGLIVDRADAGQCASIEALGVVARARQTLMQDLRVSRELAADVMKLSEELR